MESSDQVPEAHFQDTAAIHIPRSGRPYPAVAGAQGPRLQTFVTQISAFDIEDVLGHDPRSRNIRLMRDARLKFLYNHVFRKTSADRVRAITAYYEERVFEGHPILGAVPAVSVAIEHPVEFAVVPETRFLGTMYLETGRRNRRLVLDGIARITGFLDLVDQVTGETLEPDDCEALRQYLEQCSLPVTFYAPRKGQQPLSQEEMEQVFCDFNFRGRLVSPKDAIALDHSDPYVAVTRYLDLHCDAISKHGGMETKRASLGSKSSAIVVQPVLLRFVRGAIEGEAYLEAAINTKVDNPRLTNKTSHRMQARLADFIDALASAMGPLWVDKSSMHLSSPGWQVIAILYHDVAMRLRKDEHAVAKFAGAIARLDWCREGLLFAPLMMAKVDPKTGREKMTLGAGATTRRRLIEVMRKELGLTEQLAAIESDAGA